MIFHYFDDDKDGDGESDDNDNGIKNDDDII